MLVLKVTMLEGRTPEQKAALVERLTNAACEQLGAERDDVRVIIYEVPATNWGTGGTTMASKAQG